jgi:hypothetical protein
MTIDINAEDTLALVQDEVVETPIVTINEQDHEGHCWLYLELDDGREFISHDDGQTWSDDWE